MNFRGIYETAGGDAMKKTIITISREFGSGGRTIGKKLAERLGYRFYDRELIEDVMEASGLSREIVEKYDEYATHKSSFLYTIAMQAGADAMGTLSFANKVQIAQVNAIKQVAEDGNCVIIGRGADFVLQDREDALHVFIRADMEFRKNRVETHYGKIDYKTENRLRDKDAKRRVYYRNFAMKEWGMCDSYNIMLDSSTFGIEGCVDILERIVRKSWEEKSE